MRLAMRVPGKKGDGSSDTDGLANGAADNTDPREQESAEIIDLASRTAYPAVTAGKGKSDGLGLAAGVALVGLLGAVSFWGMNSARLAEPDVAAAEPAAATPQPRATGAAKPVVAAAAKPKVPGATNPVVRNPAPSPVLVRNPGANVAPVPRANPYNSPTIVFDAGAAASSAAPGLAIPAPAIGAGNAPNRTAGPVGSAAAFASSIGGVGGGTAEAEAMVNPSTTVTEGTLIPAVLETAINTDVPGYVRAVVSQDVRSFDGTKVLIPRSSRVIGQYQSGVQNGQKRAYVIWTRLIRPDGASIAIASPGVGYDGTTGIAGDVDTHFFSRFGSAMLLSVVGGLGAIASGGASVVIGGAGQSAASTALQQDGQRGPTIRVRQGEPIRIFTARDLGFSGV